MRWTAPAFSPMIVIGLVSITGCSGSKGGPSDLDPSYVVLDENMTALLVPTIQNFGEHIFPSLTALLEEG